MKPSDEAVRSADLLERLLTDARFRAKFRNDPAGVAREFGVAKLADELASAGKSMQTLELRESRSGLAGVVMAAAVEVVGVVDLVRHFQMDETTFTPEAARAVGDLVSRPSLKAIKLVGAETPNEADLPFANAGDIGGKHGAPSTPDAGAAPGARLTFQAPGVETLPSDPRHSGGEHAHEHHGDEAPSPGGARPEPGERNASAVFSSISEDSPSVGRPAPEDAVAAGIGGNILPDGPDTYPGDNAAEEEVAAWMGRRARQAGLPAELPVMASLVESRLRNLNFGDADSVGFFQMRLSIWNRGDYAGYPDNPELQLQWFIDHALKVRQSRLKAGMSDPAEDPQAWGEWIADIERPAAQFRHRYKLQLDEASRLVDHLRTDASAGGMELAGGFSGGDNLAELLDNPRLHLPAGARADLAEGLVDQRLVAALARLTEFHEIGLSVIKTGHSKFTASGSVSNHFHGRGLDISMVDGVPVSPGNSSARDFVEKLLALESSVRPTEVISPFKMPGSSSDSGHLDHIHVAFDDPIGPDFELPTPQPHGHDHSEHIAPASEVRASAVFAAVQASEAPAAGHTVELPAMGRDEGLVAQASLWDADPSGRSNVLIPPIAPEELANTNAGGSLHGSEFGVPSPEGALGPTGRVHAGYDLFAIGGSSVRAPSAGTIIEVRASRGSSGQLFGGTVKVQCDDGRIWVFRHVDPAPLSKGMRIPAGHEIATVTPWNDGPPHAHVELWKRLDGGYVITNLEDPLIELKRAYSRH